MNIEQLSNMTEINDTDEKLVRKIALDIIENGWNDTPILIAHDYLAITGSHRIEAARYLLELDEESDWQLGYADIDVYYLDVTEYVEKWCLETGSNIEFDALHKIFTGTDIEDIVSKNQEW